ncbi:helix-turn-helix transcriptional regulator [uncultured Ruminococcus sp.]|uniref:helix-turn-helix domain-containing protein n=1 Tax=uncultured Ruminococcus sp. TaxID=165186 RepID=UPI00204FC5DF|nr:helix-turn-helix transcriptional regulator [uncultured Ruminococcus sp.]DAN88764.1 MAG TPA: helix-turn-helix domain protein [Caudoviricetes sp.]
MKKRVYLIDLRNKKGLTQLDISKSMGISESYYNLIEQGQRQKNMNIVILYGLSKALKVPVNTLVDKEINFARKGDNHL